MCRRGTASGKHGSDRTYEELKQKLKQERDKLIEGSDRTYEELKPTSGKSG